MSFTVSVDIIWSSTWVSSSDIVTGSPAASCCTSFACYSWPTAYCSSPDFIFAAAVS